MAYKPIEPNTWKPENKGETFEGILIEKKENIGTNKSNLYCFEDFSKKPMMIWGSAIIDDKMNYVKIGDKVKITYNGRAEKGKAGKNPPKLFRIEVDVAE